MDNILRFLKLAVALIAFVIVVSYVFKVANLGSSLIVEKEADITSFSNSVKESDLLPYVNTQVSGAFVVGVANKYRHVIPIKIYTGAVPTGFYNTSRIQDSKSETYVNPMKQFTFYEGKNSADETEILIFVQSGLTKQNMGIAQDTRIQDAYDVDMASSIMYATRLQEYIAIKEADIRAKKDELNSVIADLAECQYLSDVQNNQSFKSIEWYRQMKLSYDSSNADRVDKLDCEVYK